jgi:hypothetical protein
MSGEQPYRRSAVASRSVSVLWNGLNRMTLFNLLPEKTSEITFEEIAELSAVFGEGGEMQADRVA